CLKALEVLGRFMERAVHDPGDDEAREQMMFAAMLAGIGFGNAGCHAPHGMSYAVSGLVRDFRPAGYSQSKAIVPHGMSVIINAPAVFAFTAPACPGRHLIAARALGSDSDVVDEAEAGPLLSARIVALMRATGMPNGLRALGYSLGDVAALTNGAFPQRRLFANSPRDISRDDLERLFTSALSYS
ncbi:MAG: iron-containing alcohol dehydrogenase, partial [Candidatus Eremiobacteraeota bacterium]|nr:iron-containing alcohol dehydrogenase [Candidatus Eremiobacteraeota bacterium]